MNKAGWKANCRSSRIIREALTEQLHTMCLISSSLRDRITRLEEGIKNQNFMCTECGLTCDTLEEMKEHHKTHSGNIACCVFCGVEFTGDDSSTKIIEHIFACDKHPLNLRIRELEVQAGRRDVYMLEQSDAIGKHWARIQELEAKYEPITELTESPDDELNPDDFREEL
jgi:uncharacterized coiled-coil protein SlyX